MSSLKTEGLVTNDIKQKSNLQETCDMMPPMIGIDMASANALISEALSKFKNVEETNSYPDDSKLLANPKGIIKSYLNQAEATDPVKFDAYRKLCVAHIKEFHNCQKGTNPTCLVCSEVFQHWNTLQRHLQTHVDFRPFSCEICSRTFYSQSKLKRHAVIHNDVKPYKCPVCDRRLGRTEHLKRHLLVHSDNKPYGCSGCAHTTKRLDGIRRHIKRKHGSGAEIISIVSKKSEPELLERFSNFINTVEKDEENIAESEMSSSHDKPNKMADEVSLKENFSNEFKESIICSDSEDFIRKIESFEPSSRDLLADSGDLSSCQHSVENSPENEKVVNQMVRRTNPDTAMGGKLGGRGRKEKTFPDWDHGPLMLSSQLFHQNLSGIHLHKANQNQSLGTIVNQAFQKPFQAQAEVNILYNDSETFPQNDSNDSNQCLSNTLGMSTSAILPPRFCTTGSARQGQINLPTVSGFSPEMMISQYFQSHQRFGSHVWGFTTNSPYPNNY